MWVQQEGARNRNRSPSSRRAWVEILTQAAGCYPCRVALLAEGVGRNTQLLRMAVERKKSPSSRRAWVEMPCNGSMSGTHAGRPPRGGRG